MAGSKMLVGWIVCVLGTGIIFASRASSAPQQHTFKGTRYERVNYEAVPLESVPASEVEYVDGPLAPLYEFLIQRRLQRFCKLLRDAGLEQVIQDVGGSWTLLAPTDPSFIFLPGGTLEQLQRNPQMLRDFILYHFIPGDFSSSQIQNEMLVNSVQGSPLRFNIYGQIMTVSGAQILEKDLMSDLGRIYIIDRPLYPIASNDIVSYLQKNYREIYRLLLETGLTDYISSGTFTFLVPDDAAFNYLSIELKDALAANRSLAERILLNHILPGSVYVGGITDGMQWETVGGSIITFTVKRGLTFANDIPIVLPDVPLTNGVIHVINRVLLPEGVENDCQCKPSSDTKDRPGAQSWGSSRPSYGQNQRTPVTRPGQALPRPTVRPFGPPGTVPVIEQGRPGSQISSASPGQPVNRPWGPPRTGQTVRPLPPSSRVTQPPHVSPASEPNIEDDINSVVGVGEQPISGHKRPDQSRTTTRYPQPPPRQGPTQRPTPQRIASQSTRTPQSGSYPGHESNENYPEQDVTITGQTDRWSNRQRTPAPRYPTPQRGSYRTPVTTQRPHTTRTYDWNQPRPSQPDIQYPSEGPGIDSATLKPDIAQTRRPEIQTTSWRQRNQVTGTTLQPNQRLSPPRTPHISTTSPIKTPTDEQPFESNRQQPNCRRQSDRITPSNRNLPVCSESSPDGCQNLPYNPADSRPLCPEYISPDCRDASEPYNPADNRPPCQSDIPAQDCREFGKPTYTGDRRPICRQTSGPQTGCKDPSAPYNPSDRRPLCRTTVAPSLISPTTQGISTQQGCRRADEVVGPQDRRPLCPEEPQQDCRPFLERPKPGDRRPVCSVNRQQTQPKPTKDSDKDKKKPIKPQQESTYPPRGQYPTQTTRQQTWQTTTRQQQQEQPTYPQRGQYPTQTTRRSSWQSTTRAPQSWERTTVVGQLPGKQPYPGSNQTPSQPQSGSSLIQPQTDPQGQHIGPVSQPQSGSYPSRPSSGSYPPQLQPGHPSQPQTGSQPTGPHSGSSPSQPQSGSYPSQPHSGSQPSQPQSGSYPSQPQSGSHPSQPQSGSHPSQPHSGPQPSQPQSGSYPSQPQSGSHPSQPQTGSYPSETHSGSQPVQPQSGSYPSQPQSGSYPSQPQSGSHPSQPQSGSYPSRPSQPHTGSQPSQPQSGSYPSQPHSGSHPSQPHSGSQPQSGSYPSQPSGPFQPQSGSQPSQPSGPFQPHSGSQPSQPSGPFQPHSGSQPSQPQSGSYPSQPHSGRQPSQPQSGSYPSQPQTTRGQFQSGRTTPDYSQRRPGSHQTQSRFTTPTTRPQIHGVTQPGSADVRPGQPFVPQGRPSSGQGHPSGSLIPSGRPTGTRVPISVTGTTTTGEDTRRTLYEIVEDPALLIKGRPVKLTRIFSLFQKAGLEDILTGPGPTTVFLPSDDAFALLPQGVIEQLEQNPELLRQVLLYHVTKSEILPSAQGDSFIVPSVEGAQLVITMLNGGRLILISGAKAVAVTRANNGIFYVINQLLYPLPHRDIFSAIQSRPDLSTLSTLLPQSGLQGLLTGQTPHTLLAPTDNAFAQLPQVVYDELVKNTTALRELIMNHIIEGAHYGREFFTGGTFPNARGGKLKFQVVSYGYQVNDVNIKTPEIVTGTGVIHLVDQVLLEEPDLLFFTSLENAVAGEDGSLINAQQPGVRGQQSGVGRQPSDVPRTSYITVTDWRSQPGVGGLQPSLGQPAPVGRTPAYDQRGPGYPQTSSGQRVPGHTSGPSSLGGHQQATPVQPQTSGNLGSRGQQPSLQPNQQTHGQQVPGLQTPGLQRPGQQTPGHSILGSPRSPTGQQVPGQQTPGLQIPGQQTPGHSVLGSPRSPTPGQQPGSFVGQRQPAIQPGGQTFTGGRIHGTFQSSGQANDVAELARTMGLNQFANWVTNTGLLEKIHDGGVYTVFAPTDEAVSTLPQDMVSSIQTNPEQVKPILQYHIVPQRLNLNSVTNEETASTLLQGKTIRFNVYQNSQPDCKQLVTVSGTPVGESLATMGSIQVIPVTQVLYQPAGNLLKIVEASPILHKLSEAVKSASLTWVLSGTGPFTIFAPSDTAFQSLTEEQRKSLIENKQAFSELLKRHIIRGTFFSSGIQDDIEKKSENNKPIKLSLQEGILTVNSIPVTYADITASNGVLHVIDSFLL